MTDKRARNEIIKENSRQLRGTIAPGLADIATGAISEDDQQLVKFHGTYLQDDRDVRAERTKKKLEKAYSFMIRVRLPGGKLSPKQWLALDDIAMTYANHSLRLTTRQTFQFHGIIKSNMKRTMRALNTALLDTIAACGDVNRNVLSVANPYLSALHAAAYDLAGRISTHLLPRTGAYHEIWLDGEKYIDTRSLLARGTDALGGRLPVGESPGASTEEPIYGAHYLPRKFKIVVAVPPDNDVDIFAQDLGYIAIVENGEIVGWNVTAGGGMGMTHGEAETFPRTADVLGFCTPEQAVDVAEKVVTVQRDWGNRENRKRARLKYTIEDRGLENFRAEVEKRLGFKFGKARPYTLTTQGDPLGWRKGPDGASHLTLFIENGRIADKPGHTLRSALREIAEKHDGAFVCTSNQNVIVANVKAKDKKTIDAILKKHGVVAEASSGLRRNSMACVALPTCGLALAESERYLPKLISQIEETLDDNGLKNDDIAIRMTGCPNGCARPYLAEIALVGRSPGVYNLYLGAAFNGTRLNKLYAPDLKEAEIAKTLLPLLERYGKERKAGEHFGDFVIRKGIVAATTAGNRFHADVGPKPAVIAAK